MMIIGLYEITKITICHFEKNILNLPTQIVYDISLLISYVMNAEQ